jgi:hypothetical protein
VARFDEGAELRAQSHESLQQMSLREERWSNDDWLALDRNSREVSELAELDPFPEQGVMRMVSRYPEVDDVTQGKDVLRYVTANRDHFDQSSDMCY